MVLPPVQHRHRELLDISVVAGEAARRRDVLGEVALELRDKRKRIARCTIAGAVAGDAVNGLEPLHPRHANDPPVSVGSRGAVGAVDAVAAGGDIDRQYN